MHFYFELRYRDMLVEDEEGRDLPDLAAARREALRGIRSVIADDVLKGLLDLTAAMVVCDAAHAVVLTIGFAEALEIVGRWVPPEGS